MSAQSLAAVMPDFDVLEAEIDDPAAIIAQSEVIGAAIDAAANNYGFDGSGQTVAVIDSGIAFDHHALGNGYGEGYKVVGGYDFAEKDDNPYDDGPAGFHGTHVAGIIASEDDTYQGIASGADLVGLRVFNDAGEGNIAWVEQALRWVHNNKDSFENPITTVNLSLGTTWNGTNTPEWATLEEEFAVLEADGIFISVAAGNDFEAYTSKGLSYPAVSEFVVPVSSYDSNYELSDFSQRDDNVLVAPGERITSTVPGHVFGGGQDNFLGATGTSQAAPYVAGASAVLREAFYSVGIDDVNQDLLYDKFIETSDQIFDAITNTTYSQINLQAAIASVLENGSSSNGSSDNGSSDNGSAGNDSSSSNAGRVVADPAVTNNTNLGVIDSAEVIKGSIAGSNETDQYSFEAGFNGTVSFDLRVTNELSPTFEIRDSDGQAVAMTGSGNSVSFDVVNGESYRVALSSDNGGGNYRLQIGVEQVQVAAPVDVTLNNGVLSVIGTAADDDIAVSESGNKINVTANGQSYQFNSNSVTRIVVNGNEGTDTVQLTGTSGNDRVSTNSERTILISGGRRTVATNFENVAIDGAGGTDTATLLDSAGNDTFEISDGHATTTQQDVNIEVEGFERIRAVSAEGNDTLIMNDSAGDDTVNVREDRIVMKTDQSLNVARGFSDVTIVSSGGTDLANLFGTSGSDTYRGDADTGTLETSSRTTTIKGFDQINVNAETGANDRAFIVGSDGDDKVNSSGSSVSAQAASGTSHRVINFDSVEFDGSGGDDLVNIQGSNGNDQLTIQESEVELENTVATLRLRNVERANFFGNGGVDEVRLADGEALDLLSAVGDQATALYDNLRVNTEDVAYLEANAVDGAIAAYDFEKVDFQYSLSGRWQQK